MTKEQKDKGLNVVMFRKSSHGAVHNQAVTLCVECNSKLGLPQWQTIYNSVYGIGEDSGSDTFLIECPHCFCRYWFHADEMIGEFFDAVESNKNRFFKPNGDKK